MIIELRKVECWSPHLVNGQHKTLHTSQEQTCHHRYPNQNSHDHPKPTTNRPANNAAADSRPQTTHR